MIDLKEALKIAETRRKNLNQYAEYENGFVFSNTDDVNGTILSEFTPADDWAFLEYWND